MKKEIRIKYVGFWDAFDYKKFRVHEILEKHYSVSISENPEYVICSSFNNEFLQYRDAIRIFYTGENVIPDFNLYDYAIGFDELFFGDRYIRIPNYIINPKYDYMIKRMENKHIEYNSAEGKRFCSFVVSNGNADPMRDYIFDKISEYRKVDSGGRYRNNIGIANGVEDKLTFQEKYKFALAVENTSYSGYLTEKLVEAFAAGGVPIYWGDPKVGKYFNTRAFVNVLDYTSVEDAIEEIKRIDQDENLYMSYVKTPALNDCKYVENSLEELENFICAIFEQSIEQARRRPTGFWGEHAENNVKKQVIYDKKQKMKLWRKKIFR